jgi:hypothetical protein
MERPANSQLRVPTLSTGNLQVCGFQVILASKSAVVKVLYILAVLSKCLSYRVHERSKMTCVFSLQNGGVCCCLVRQQQQ